MSVESSGRSIDFRKLPTLAQAMIYSHFVSSFLHDTFLEQMGSALSLSAGMCGCLFEDKATADLAIDRATKAACAVLLEHGRLIQPAEIAAAWENRREQE